MEQEVLEQVDEEYRLQKMGNCLSNIFLNVHIHGMDSNLRKKVERELERWNEKYDRNITLADLAKFMLQVGGRIFSPKKEEEEAVDEQGSR